MRSTLAIPTPSCSDWISAWMKVWSSSTPERRPMSSRASSRGRPSRISLSTWANSSDSAFLNFSTSRPMAASKPSPASTEMVSRSSAFGSASRSSVCRPLIRLLSSTSGRKRPPTNPRPAAASLSANVVGNTKPPNQKATRATTSPAITLNTSKPLTVRPYGRPARFSLFWTTNCRFFAIRAVSKLPSRSSAGLMNRSLNGRESSISSRVRL